jgi:hypothetical protein
MRTPPITMIRLLEPFAPLFSKRVFRHAQVLVAGAILAPGRRTISSALRAMGLDQHKRFHCYHRVLREALVGREVSPSWVVGGSVRARKSSFGCGHRRDA